MAENKALNEEALVEMAHTMGFDLAHAFAAAADAFARGVADGFAAYAQELAAENGGVELVHDEEDEEPELKTDIQDCRRCWCDTCGRLEECGKHRDGHTAGRLAPASVYRVREWPSVQAEGRRALRRVHGGRGLQ